MYCIITDFFTIKEVIILPDHKSAEQRYEAIKDVLFTADAEDAEEASESVGLYRITDIDNFSVSFADADLNPSSLSITGAELIERAST